MNTNIKIAFLAAALFAFISIGGATVQAATLEGVVQGFGCYTNHKVCPIDRMDPHLAIEKSFVVVDKDGTYYLVSNISSGVLARNALNKVRVTGAVNSKYNSINADKLEVFKDNKWNEVWSKKAEQEEIERYNLGT